MHGPLPFAVRIEERGSWAHLGDVGDGGDEVVGEIRRVRVQDADPLHALDGRHLVQQARQVFAVLRVGVHAVTAMTKNLRTVGVSAENIAHTRRVSRRRFPKDTGLPPIPRAFLPALPFLTLSECIKVTAVGLRAVILTLSECIKVTAVGLRAVILTLSECIQVTAVGLRAVILTLSECIKVTAVGLRAVILTLSECIQVTAVGLRAVISLPAHTRPRPPLRALLESLLDFKGLIGIPVGF
jgi:hypothetical protein